MEGSRSPYGERGLKWIPRLPRSLAMESLSLRRAWIEITSVSLNLMRVSSRSPYGERGLKCVDAGECVGVLRRSPYGERGLKCSQLVHRDGIGLGRSPYGERGLK